MCCKVTEKFLILQKNHLLQSRIIPPLHIMEAGSYITVQGNSSLQIVPDIMRLEIGVSDSFDTYDEAYERGEHNARWVKEILRTARMNPEVAKAIEFNLSETSAPEGERRVFNLSQKMMVDLPVEPRVANEVIKMAGENIPGVEITVGFTLRDVQHLQLRLIEKAVSDAGLKAKVMAEAAGCLLGRVAKINYMMGKPDVYRHARTIHNNEEAKASTPEALDMCPSGILVTDNVEVTWSLR